MKVHENISMNFLLHSNLYLHVSKIVDYKIPNYYDEYANDKF